MKNTDFFFDFFIASEKLNNFLKIMPSDLSKKLIVNQKINPQCVKHNLLSFIIQKAE